ncbi:LPS-assembly lipoprotein LptE [Candidatus Thiodiazotropha sp. CDECU1]|uniref:LPS-assembly lipoprotein LptE n=1 Tax=Candidatus Thiodiazotropha sp. CDECU1 TaxID=3065865 RepID=UPI00292DCE3D|nr:LPS assembly lipoprotein LptE [Candidatus Thiodiazotropha sp. CDECU1]
MPSNSIRFRQQLLWVVLISTLVTGCGFHLKGYRQLSTALNGLYIIGFEKPESLAAVLHDNLQGRGAALAPELAAAKLSIEILEEKFTSRVLSVDAGGKALDKEMQLSALIRARVPGSGEKGVEQQLELLRQLSFSGDDELGQRNEADLMKYDMRNEMAEQIIRRLEAIK